MKKHLLSFLLLVAPIALITINAQKALEKGTIKMEITKVGSDDAQMAQQLEMAKGTSFTIIFKGDESITKTSLMGGMVKTDIKMRTADHSYPLPVHVCVWNPDCFALHPYPVAQSRPRTDVRHVSSLFLPMFVEIIFCLCALNFLILFSIGIGAGQ